MGKALVSTLKLVLQLSLLYLRSQQEREPVLTPRPLGETNRYAEHGALSVLALQASRVRRSAVPAFVSRPRLVGT